MIERHHGGTWYLTGTTCKLKLAECKPQSRENEVMCRWLVPIDVDQLCSLMTKMSLDILGNEIQFSTS